MAPENTLAAFRRAIMDGAEGIEFDVRLAKDGVVVFHDPTLNRVGRKKGKINQISVTDLQKTDVGSWFNARYPRLAQAEFFTETVPTFKQVLEFLGDFRGLIFIELKCRQAEIELLSQEVAKIVVNSPLQPQIIVKSFQLEVIPQIKKLCPEVKTAALFAPKIMTILRKEKRLVNIAHELEADMLSVHFSLATRKLMKKAERRNLPVTVWTADHPRWIKRAFDLELFGIITNNPARLLERKAEYLLKNK